MPRRVAPMLKHEKRIVGHVSGWQEFTGQCVCGKPWPCPEVQAPLSSNQIADESPPPDPMQLMQSLADTGPSCIQKLGDEIRRLRAEVERLRTSLQLEVEMTDSLQNQLSDLRRSGETPDEPSVLGAGCGFAPKLSPSEGVEAAVRLIQKICAEHNLDPAQWLHGEKIDALITERDEAIALAAIWHESCTGKHGSQEPCVPPVKTSESTRGTN